MRNGIQRVNEIVFTLKIILTLVKTKYKLKVYNIIITLHLVLDTQSKWLDFDWKTEELKTM